MSSFQAYFQLGFKHISDLAGYDHILFIIALCAIYSIKEWKKILILVTAFTIGHSVTLALSALNVVNIKAELIEFLIPLTIFLTAIHNVVERLQLELSNKMNLNYFLALGFGLIHGLGFSNYLKMLLGNEANIVGPLFAFNIGLEVGQILIVAIFMLLTTIMISLFGVRKRDWTIFVSGAAAGIALILMQETKFW